MMEVLAVRAQKILKDESARDRDSGLILAEIANLLDKGEAEGSSVVLTGYSPAAKAESFYRISSAPSVFKMKTASDLSLFSFVRQLLPSWIVTVAVFGEPTM